jgi:hypothetical protein
MGIATAEPATSVGRFGTRFVNGEATPAELIFIQLGDGLLRLLVRGHFHERKATRPPGGHVTHDPDRFDGPGAPE